MLSLGVGLGEGGGGGGHGGGVHFQLTYVSKEDLLAAKKTPDEYKNLRVRVSGFSDYFVRLNDALQDDIIERTEHK